MLITASANDFLTIFVGIELSAFSSYGLVAFRKTNDKSTEAGAKYLLIGAFSSALTLYGISLLYALTGSVTFEGVNAFLTGLENGVIDGDFNEPLPFANILLKETGEGVTSDFDGKYSFELEQGTYTLQFSFVGYETKIITEIQVMGNE